MTNFPGKQKILFWQERKRLKQEIRRAILAAMTLAENPKDRVIIEKFVDCIEPGTLYDTARLPYRGNLKGNAWAASKIHCIFARISEVIGSYWTYICTENPENVSLCEGWVEGLKLICDNYDTLTVHGDPAKGYWLG